MQAVRIVGRQFVKQGPGAFVDFHDIDAGGGRVQQGTGQATGTGADFDDAAACEVTAEGCDPGADARIKEEVLA
jgi:hypothetical protein